jgi:hypothetical protein
MSSSIREQVNNLLDTNSKQKLGEGFAVAIATAIEHQLGVLRQIQAQKSQPPEHQEIVKAVETYVKAELAATKVDDSHDWSHIDNVRKLALRLHAQSKDQPEYECMVDNPDERSLVIELAALLHDIKDYK